MNKFLLSNGFHNTSSTTAKGLVLTGYLIPATALILPGALLIFTNAKLVVIEIETLLYEQVALTISPTSTDQLKANGINLRSLFGAEAQVVNPD